MRDPGHPRRNPFFEHGSDGAADDPGMGWRDPVDDAEDGAAGGGEAPAGPAGGFAAVLALAEALGDAQPEAAEHLVAAAHEVVLTVKVLVDATEAALAEQRAALEARNRRAQESRRAQQDAERAPAGEPRGRGAVTDLAVHRRTEAP
jgi:hypothetical protein